MFDSCKGMRYDRSKGAISSFAFQCPPVETSMAPMNTSSSGRPPRASKSRNMRATDKIRAISMLNSMVNDGTFGHGSAHSSHTKVVLFL